MIAFARTHGQDWAIAVVVRCVASLRAPVVGPDQRKFWESTTLPLADEASANWVNVLAGREESIISSAQGRVSLSDVFAGFPVALLLPHRSLDLPGQAVFDESPARP